jgi:four helix bundle protein
MKARKAGKERMARKWTFREGMERKICLVVAKSADLLKYSPRVPLLTLIPESQDGFMSHYQGGFRKLIVWREAKALALRVYEVTKNFPREEIFGITNQLRRASASVQANIAEGSAMPTKDHRKRFYAIARGSAVEVDSFLELSFDLHYLQQADYDELSDRTSRTIFLITRLAQL